jgi:hypothetical protein
MSKKVTFPWLAQASDFSNEGFHTNPSSGYILLLAALRISPSYELARKVRKGEITHSEIKKLPKDFDQVLATYDLIGDVNKIVFRYWWLQRGIKIFGVPNKKPELKVIDTFVYGEEFDVEYLNKNLATNFVHEHRNEGFPPAMLLSIPLTLKRTEILKKINSILDANKVHLDEPKKQPLMKLMNKRLNRHAMNRGFNLMWAKSIFLNKELWRLGVKARISETYSSVLNYNAPRKPKDAIEMNDRMILTKITYRTLKRYELIVENAARGKFPCDDPVESAEFDYPAIGKREKIYRKWRKENLHDPLRLKY